MFAVTAPPLEEKHPLYLAGLALERDARFSAEMAEWEKATIGAARKPRVSDSTRSCAAV
jgi:hypothetical protein